jgi:hypothetical protein
VNEFDQQIEISNTIETLGDCRAFFLDFWGSPGYTTANPKEPLFVLHNNLDGILSRAGSLTSGQEKGRNRI